MDRSTLPLGGSSLADNLVLPGVPGGMLRRAAEVIDLFRRLRGAGQTIVMVTHSAAVAAGAARIVRMHDGRVDEPGDEQGDEPECGLPSPGCDLTRGGAGAR